jgi:hypothetical protein
VATFCALIGNSISGPSYDDSTSMSAPQVLKYEEEDTCHVRRRIHVI